MPVGTPTPHFSLDNGRSLDRAAWPEVSALCRVGQNLHARGWSLGTSSNYSVILRRDPLQILVTASGKDKGRLTPADFVVVDSAGQRCQMQDPKPSAETLLHCIIAQQPGVGAILHTHSIWGTVLSDRFHETGGFTMTGYEMLKGLAGVTTHEHREVLEVFENTQDIPALARELAARFADQSHPLRHGFLIRRHGLYTWGADLEEAFRQIEIFEFLFEVIGRSLLLPDFVPTGVSPR